MKKCSVMCYSQKFYDSSNSSIACYQPNFVCTNDIRTSGLL